MLPHFFIYIKEKIYTMKEILYVDGLKWRNADFRLKIQYSMSVVLIMAGIVLAFLSFIIMNEIGAGVFGMSSFFVGAALAIYGIGVMVKNQLNDMNILVKDEINKLQESERKRNERFNKRYYPDGTADDFSDLEHLPVDDTGKDDRTHQD